MPKTILGAVIVGNIVSFIAGLLAINFLIGLISKRGLAILDGIE